MKIKFIIYSIIILIAHQSAFSAVDESEKLLKDAITRISKVADYTCDVELIIDVDFIKIGNRKGKLTFMKPDSIKYDIEGFALLPKIDFFSQIKKINSKEFTIIAQGTEKVSNAECKVLKIIPNKIDADLILGQLWIDNSKDVRKVVLFTKEQGKVEFAIDYENSNFTVPKMLTLSFDIKDMKLPAGMTGDISSLKDNTKAKTSKGKIIIKYANYKFGK